MAARYWIKVTAGVWNATANWSASSGGGGGSSVPVAGDAVTFDSNGLGDCSLDRNEACTSITIASGATGQFDCVTFNLTLSGSFIADDGDLLFGSGVISIGGGFDVKDTASCDYETCKVIMTGTTSAVFFDSDSASTSDIQDLEISGTVTLTSGPFRRAIISNNLNIVSGGTLTNNAGSNRETSFRDGATLTVQAGGTMAGSFGARWTNINNSSSGVTVMDGTWTAGTLVFPLVLADPTIVPGTYSTTVLSFDTTNGGTPVKWTPDAGSYSFGTIKLLDADVSVEIDCSTNNPTMTVGDLDFNGGSGAGDDAKITNGTNNWTITGDVTVTIGGSGGFTWTKGTGSITFSGTANQNVDFNGEAVEDITIDKTAGKVTLTGDVSTDSVTCTDGELDIDGNNLTTVSSGDFTVAANFTLSDTTGGGLITVAGNLDINGTSGNTVTWDGPDLNVTGTADADFTVVTNSDASAGTEVDATDDCTDSGGNTNWNFAVSAAIVANSGSFVVTGIDAETIRGRPLTAGSGSFLVTGTAVGTIRNRTIVANSGSFLVTGTAASTGITIPAGSGSFLVTGTAVGTIRNRTIVANSGSFLVTGIDAETIKGRTLVADSGAFTFTGTAVGTIRNRTIVANSGSFLVTGTAASTGTTIPAGSGSFLVTGTAVGTIRNRTIVANSGSFLVTGTAATLIEEEAELLSADSGAFTFTGTAASLIHDVVCDTNVSLGFKMAAPYPTSQTTSLLPSPRFSDGESPTVAISATRSMDGTLRTYIKTKGGRRKLLWSFLLTRHKALEVREFVRAYFASQIEITDHKDRRWVGQFTNNPFEFTTENKATPAIDTLARGEHMTVQLEFEGIEQ